MEGTDVGVGHTGHTDHTGQVSSGTVCWLCESTNNHLAGEAWIAMI